PLFRLALPFLPLPLPPSSPLSPYTTLFRSARPLAPRRLPGAATPVPGRLRVRTELLAGRRLRARHRDLLHPVHVPGHHRDVDPVDRKSTRLNSSHEWISYAVFCLKKKTKTK